MVGHQLVIYLANYNNNLTLQMYFNGSTNCYLGEVMMVPKIATQNPGGCTCTPLHLPVGAHECSAYTMPLKRNETTWNSPYIYINWTCTLVSWPNSKTTSASHYQGQTGSSNRPWLI